MDRGVVAHVLTLSQTELDLYKHVVCHEAWDHIADRSGGQVKAVETRRVLWDKP